MSVGTFGILFLSRENAQFIVSVLLVSLFPALTLLSLVSHGTLGIQSLRSAKAVLMDCVRLRSFLFAVFRLLTTRTIGAQTEDILPLPFWWRVVCCCVSQSMDRAGAEWERDALAYWKY